VVGFDWAPDSATFVFDYGCSVYRRNADGSNQVTTDSSDCYDDAPTVNPVTGQIAGHNVNGGLYLMNADGSGKTFVPNTHGGGTPDVWPRWSHDGQWIAFVE
jgi:Tol biopolymer transport system component